MSYVKLLNTHLAAYKRSSLGISAPGSFNYRGRMLAYDHILPLEHTEQNLLPMAKSVAEDYVKAHSIRLHKHFHHLNSSQAFAFNLFLPYFAAGGRAAQTLLRALGQEDTLVGWQLEAVPDPIEASNIDAVWITGTGHTTICEVKLSEASFGKTADDTEHRRKIAEIYAPVLQGHYSAEQLTPEAFCRAYQFNRNVWHMLRLEQSMLMLLLPRKNRTLWRELVVMLNSVTAELRARIKVVAIEDVMAKLVLDHQIPETLREHANLLARKYVI